MTDKEAWGHANIGRVVLQPEPDATKRRGELELGLGLFERIGDRSAPSRRRRSCAWPDRPTAACPEWLAEALAFADEAGDRSRQLGTLTTLAWHHFIRSLWGTAARQSAEAEGFASRLAELAEELGAVDMAVHGRSLLAIMARFSGRLDEAAASHRSARSVSAGSVDDESYPWLGLRGHLRGGRGPRRRRAWRRPSHRSRHPTRCRDGAAPHRGRA